MKYLLDFEITENSTRHTLISGHLVSLDKNVPSISQPSPGRAHMEAGLDLKTSISLNHCQ